MTHLRNVAAPIAGFSASARRSFLAAALATLACAAAPTLAQSADNYPSKAVKLVVPYPPGGATDIVGRALGDALAKKWRQPVIIENRPGAGGNLGSAHAARSAADRQSTRLNSSH